MSDHYTVEFGIDGEGWWPGRCSCGWDGGMYPEAEDAADALMQHSRDEGYAQALRDAVAMSPGEADRG